MLKKWINLIAFVLTTICAQITVAAPTCVMNSKIGNQLDLPIYEWVDNQKPRRGIIVAVTALTFYAKSWDCIARHLASKGYQVLALEMRGFWILIGQTLRPGGRFADQLHLVAALQPADRFRGSQRNSRVPAAFTALRAIEMYIHAGRSPAAARSILGPSSGGNT